MRKSSTEAVGKLCTVCAQVFSNFVGWWKSGTFIQVNATRIPTSLHTQFYGFYRSFFNLPTLSTEPISITTKYINILLIVGPENT
jgi:hypothetical protein